MGLSGFAQSEAALRIRARFDDAILRQLLLERRYMQVEALLTGMSQPIISSSEVEHAIARRFIPTESLRMFAAGNVVDLGVMQVVKDGRFDLRGVAQMLGKGAMVVINHLEQRFPAVSDFAGEISEWLGEEIEVSGVLSFGNRPGLCLHHDNQNLFIVQMEGSKRWDFVGDPLTPGIIEDSSTEAEADPVSLTMNAGDVMFVPAGQRHQCQPVGFSFHLGVLVHHVKAGDLMRQFGKDLARDPALNSPLLAILGSDNEAQTIADYKARLHAKVDGLDLTGALRKRRESRRLKQDFSFPQIGQSNGREDG